MRFSRRCSSWATVMAAGCVPSTRTADRTPWKSRATAAGARRDCPPPGAPAAHAVLLPLLRLPEVSGFHQAYIHAYHALFDRLKGTGGQTPLLTCCRVPPVTCVPHERTAPAFCSVSLSSPAAADVGISAQEL